MEEYTSALSPRGCTQVTKPDKSNLTLTAPHLGKLKQQQINKENNV